MLNALDEHYDERQFAAVQCSSSGNRTTIAAPLSDQDAIKVRKNVKSYQVLLMIGILPVNVLVSIGGPVIAFPQTHGAQSGAIRETPERLLTDLVGASQRARHRS
jgi:hypothetical protein